MDNTEKHLTTIDFVASNKPDEIDHPDHILWQCRPTTKLTFKDKVRGKEPCRRINYMENDICAGCSAKRTVGALAMAREARVIGELISHDVYGNEIWRYKVEE
ncbi:hypothetical protein FVEN_g6873 [Fusarium venenatum]|uniref:Uncharacterized protein n=1 Tax=Fusarium venenatum TaxID=56646 RepID=A0A2L2SZX9_9HYPO|nr:uncharacterized protein FVRRES_00266 [Fusarium venenatum]KAG8355391.1 hypothetical protein FVEN_g6873 [Fusarium venenatum]CEI63754.1 unnamed protein product [Fusarium venenatum]